MVDPSTPMRATRLPHRLPLIYRLADEPGWQEGLTENISTSGVLFCATRDLSVNTDLEIRITLTPALPSGYAPTVRCEARVVRTESRNGIPQAFGATFTTCQLIPPEEDRPFAR